MSQKTPPECIPTIHFKDCIQLRVPTKPSWAHALPELWVTPARVGEISECVASLSSPTAPFGP